MQNVLVIDDNGGLAIAIEMLVADLGIKTCRSSNAANGLIRAAHESPMAIVVAAHLAWVGSISMTEHLRHDRRLGSTPIIVVFDGRTRSTFARDRYAHTGLSLRWPDEREELRQCILGATSEPLPHVHGPTSVVDNLRNVPGVP